MTSYVYKRCSQCCDWNYQAINNHLCQTIPENYPTCQHKNSPQPPVNRGIECIKQLKPIQQTYEVLIAASQFCAYNYWHNVWSKKNVDAYMKSVGVSSSYYKPHIIDADITSLQKNVDVKETLKLLHIPTAWNTPINLCQYIDTPMHLIFQGIVKSVIEFSFMFLHIIEKNKSSNQKYMI